MNMLKTLTLLVLGSAFFVGCGANKDEPAAQTDSAAPAAETPAAPSGDEISPTDTTDISPSDEPAPAMSDTLPTTEQPPPPEPAPPPSG